MVVTPPFVAGQFEVAHSLVLAIFQDIVERERFLAARRFTEIGKVLQEPHPPFVGDVGHQQLGPCMHLAHLIYIFHQPQILFGRDKGQLSELLGSRVIEVDGVGSEFAQLVVALADILVLDVFYQPRLHQIFLPGLARLGRYV